MRLWGRRPDKRADEYTIYFATDLHGSEICFRKFVNAAEFYKADLLILGGDVTGKLVIPIVEQAGGHYQASLHGTTNSIDGDGLVEFERDVRNMGFYPERMDRERYEHLRSHQGEIDGLFEAVMARRLVRWLELAQDKLHGTGVRIITAPGNDDPFSIDSVLTEHGGDVLHMGEGEVIEIGPEVEMLTTGYTNKTPWDTHREYPEEQIEQHLNSMGAQLQDPEKAIFNIHVPPYDSEIDTAPLLGQDLAVKTSVAGQQTAPVGSTAVRDAIERFQPSVSLHGHIHESAGAVRIGRTVAVNAGSEYTQGVLRGVLLTINRDGYVRHQAITG